jgi:mono/diheme cytochrome c family protein
MKRFMVVSMLLTTIVFVSCVLRKSEPVTQKEFVAEDERTANGERLYMMHCQKCHPGGEGGLGPAVNPNPAPGFIKRFQMRHGVGVMPGFYKHELSKNDLKDIALYMRKWKHYK